MYLYDLSFLEIRNCWCIMAQAPSMSRIGSTTKIYQFPTEHCFIYPTGSMYGLFNYTTFAVKKQQTKYTQYVIYKVSLYPGRCWLPLDLSSTLPPKKEMSSLREQLQWGRPSGQEVEIVLCWFNFLWIRSVKVENYCCFGHLWTRFGAFWGMCNKKQRHNPHVFLFGDRSQQTMFLLTWLQS